MGRGNPSYEHRREKISLSSAAEKHLVALVDEKPRARQQRPSGARKANGILGCSNRGVAAGREGTVPSALPS